MYYVEVYRGEWQLVGQYESKAQANHIAREYRQRGERARVTTEE